MDCEGGKGAKRVKKTRKIEEKKGLVWGFNYRFSLVIGCICIECDQSTIGRATRVMAWAVKSKRMADLATGGGLELSVPGGLNAKGAGEIVIRWIAGKAVGEINEELFG